MPTSLGQDWQTLLIAGNCADRILATDPQAEP
jgi:hypothetical protein